ncbi:E3 ubiquitin-protein ligase TRIM71-like [Mercenaria mercenaria]|uniref:E3 ubiquitin-protein ligase TRIM71-like n=1 Tax=Mercenaria mercenaria TaxID=6596 RepID=UPI00234ED34B|nr:E3 ubiquitin-protein ligase TRIM71-like [Mercenaria mercenaria]
MAVSGRRAPDRFSSTMSTGSGEDFELFCQPCDLADLRLPACGFCIDCEEHMCESCFNHHQRSKPSRHHKLLDKVNMPQTQQVPSKSAQPRQDDHLTTPCPQHKKETIKFYCHDHEELLCSVCVTLEHSGACRVSYIPDISEGSLDSKQYNDTLKDIDIITEKCHKIEADLKRMTIKSSNSLTDVLAEIKKLRQKTNRKLDEMEKAAEDAAKAIQLDNHASMKTAETTCGDAIKSVKALSDSIKQLNTSKQADKLFLELQHAKQLVTSNNDMLSGLKSPEDVKEYYLVPSNTISILLENEKSLGTLATKTFKHSNTPQVAAVNPGKPSVARPLAAGERAREIPPIKRPLTRLVENSGQLPNRSSPPSAEQSREITNKIQPSSTAVKSIQLSQEAEFCVKSTQDKEQCWITGMAFLTPSKLILTDSKNFSIKLVDLTCMSVIHQLNLTSYYPWDITAVSPYSTAITMPGRQIIQFVSAKSNNLSFINSFGTKGECRGICYYEKKLLVSMWTPPNLQIMNLTGGVLKTVTTLQNGGNIFARPTSITASRDYIYVSDNFKQTIIQLNWQGKQLNCFNGTGSPQGIAMLDDGSILVSDPQKNRCTIDNISGDLSQTNIVLRGFKKPHALCWCSTNRKLYVSYFTGGEQSIDNCIQVFKMI